VEQIVVQTRTRLAGEIPAGASRVVALQDTDARPIAKEHLGSSAVGTSDPSVTEATSLVGNSLHVSRNPFEDSEV
jgi:hypothetical protein